MKPPIVGYIVTSSRGPLCQGFHASAADDPIDGLLCLDSTATLWSTYDAARLAIGRTTRYSDRHGLGWHEWGWAILAVRSPGRRPR